MARPTVPVVFRDDDTGLWKCLMRDKKVGKVWGTGYGDTRLEAIEDARRDQPSSGTIKRAIGWVQRHPFIAGTAVGMYMAVRAGARTFGAAAPVALLIGAGSWVASKVARLFTR